MKKFLSVLLSAIMVLSIAVCAFAVDSSESEVLKFNSEGKFKIMMVNDTQDVGKGVQDKLVKFINAALDAEKPDLVVFAGDQLSDIYPGASKEDYKIALNNILQPLEDRKIPFIVTLGNHDHDRESVMPENEMYEVYNSYSMCYNTENGPVDDYFTCYKNVMSSDGAKAVFNIYAIDTNNKAEQGGYAGITADQLAWYNNASAQIKEANGGVVLPSLNFQHIPVKEIYQLLTECKWNKEGAVYSRRDKTWYCIDSENKNVSGAMGEAPCSEDFDIITGQYQAWLENGDVMGAFFAHDHVNTFEGVTDDGIRMGYNGGTGFKPYGNGDKRSVRVFELSEDDVTNYTTRLVTYADVCEELNIVTSDILTPVWLTRIMKVVYALFGWAIELFNK